jgi:hypothetical protein
MPEDDTETDAQINDLISSKIAAGDADSGWIVAHTMLRTLPVLKDIAAYLKAINEAIAPDASSRTVTGELYSIRSTLEKIGEGDVPNNNHARTRTRRA